MVPIQLGFSAAALGHCFAATNQRFPVLEGPEKRTMIFRGSRKKGIDVILRNLKQLNAWVAINKLSDRAASPTTTTNVTALMLSFNRIVFSQHAWLRARLVSGDVYVDEGSLQYVGLSVFNLCRGFENFQEIIHRECDNFSRLCYLI